MNENLAQDQGQSEGVDKVLKDGIVTVSVDGRSIFVLGRHAHNQLSPDYVQQEVLPEWGNGELHVILAHIDGAAFLDQLIELKKTLVCWTTHDLWATYVAGSEQVEGHLRRVRHVTEQTYQEPLSADPTDEPPIVVVGFSNSGAIHYETGPFRLELNACGEPQRNQEGCTWRPISSVVYFNGFSIPLNKFFIPSSTTPKPNSGSCKVEEDSSKLAAWAFPNKVEEINPEPWPKGKFHSTTYTRSSNDEPKLNEGSKKNIWSTIAVAIQCGVSPIGREAVRPSRPIEIKPKKDETSLIMPILGWRLRQLAQIKGDLKLEKPIPVLLMVSYQTREEVIKVLKEMYDQDNNKLLEWNPWEQPLSMLDLKVYLLQQPLVRPKQAAKHKPGELVLRGHLDLVYLALHWQEGIRETDEEMCRSYLVSFPHNNLGKVLNADAIAQNVADFSKKRSSVGVEVFEELKITERCGYRHSDRLWKRDYTDHNYANYKKFIIECDKYWASSHTWYFDLDNPSINKKSLVPFWIDSTPERQDLELLTHIPDLGVCYFEYYRSDSNQTVPHPRFVVAYSEREVQTSRVSKIIEQQETGILPDRLYDANLQKRLLLLVEPYINKNVWGGTELARIKGLNDEQWIGETWEVSTHPAGPAKVRYSEKSVPMSMVLGSNYEIMLKFLDCEDQLSVQVHPPQAAINRLRKRDEEKGILSEGADIQKEESFFVRQPSDQSFHLILGFEHKEMEPIAKQLRPILYEATAKSMDKSEITTKIASELKHAYAKTFDSNGSDKSDEEKQARKAAAAFIRNEDWGSNENLQEAIAFHLENAEQPGEIPNLANIFAGIGLIHLLRLLVDAIRDDCEHGFEKYGQHWFKSFTSSNPLLTYFHTVKAEPSMFLRVPPGVVHAWQGGGNIVMEASNRSDQTYRILDFGRELSETTSREMHYEKAMFSLSEESFLSSDSLYHLGARKADVGDLQDNFHANLNLKRISGPPRDDEYSDSKIQWAIGSTIHEVPPDGTDKDWMFLMNIDGPMEVTAVDEHVERREHLSVPALRTVMVKSSADVYVAPSHPNERVLLLSHRVSSSLKTSLLISLGATKIEVAMKKQGETPPTRYITAKPEEIARAYQNVDSLFELVGNLFEPLLGDGNDLDSNSTRVGVAWPGPVYGDRLISSLLEGMGREEMERNDVIERLKSRVPEMVNIRDCNFIIENDAAIIVKAEQRHRVGGLLGVTRGMILNCGSGLCAGFSNDAWEKDENSHVADYSAAASAIGRWLWIDPVKGLVHRTAGDWVDESQKASVNDVDPETEWPRLSAYVSTLALALRLLRRLPADKQRVFFKDLFKGNGPDYRSTTTEGYAKAYKEFKAHRHDFDRFAFLHKVNSSERNDDVELRIIRDFIVEVAGDLTSVIRAIEHYSKDIGLHPDTAKLVVLTGSIGRDFGRIDGDLLIDTMSNLLPDHDIRRTVLAVASKAEVEAIWEDNYCE